MPTEQFFKKTLPFSFLLLPVQCMKTPGPLQPILLVLIPVYDASQTQPNPRGEKYERKN